MKQLLFLLLFPCLAMAQYPGNGNQKITLGEQTSADGLVYRGVANDTNVITPFSDTSAYIILDTVNSKFYHYNRTTTYWSLAGGGVSVTSFSAGTTGLTPSTATTGAVTLGGTLAVANGGTNITTFTAANRIPYASSATALTTSENLTFDNNALLLRKNSNGTDFTTFPNIAVENTSTSDYSFAAIKVSANNDTVVGDILVDGLGAFGTPLVAFRTVTNHPFAIFTNNNERMRIASSGVVTINNLAGSGDRTVIASATGVLSAPVSSITTKENVQILNYGLNEILQINPVSFDYIDKDKWGDERKLGFIVEDIFPIVPEVTGTMNDGDLYLDMVKLIPILTKAIQEQQALIKALEQRIINLENK